MHCAVVEKFFWGDLMSKKLGSFSGPKKVKVRKKGQLTIPQSFREEAGIAENTVLEMYRAGRAIIATPSNLITRELARQVEKEMKDNNYGLKDLLAELREGSHRYAGN